MKLKKIASLALAGIMAVSMLTACGGNGETGGETGGNTGNTITTSTAVSALSNAVKAYTSATIDVKESALMNGRLDKFFSDNTYAEIKELGGSDDDASIQDEVESIFGEDMDELTAKNLKENKDTSNYYFKAIEVKNVSDATALVKAANNVGEILKAADLHDEYIVDIEGTTLANNSRYGKPGKPGKPGFDVDFDITIGDLSVSYTADYTMYVEQVTANVAGDSSVPVVIVVLKTDIAKKV